MSIVGILHPGTMGSFIASAVGTGHEVVWASAGRSAPTRARAAGFRDVDTVAALASISDTILSLCPPVHALELARDIAACGFAGVYVDANAVSPDTMTLLAQALPSATVLDGSVIGGASSDSAVLHLSGDPAASATVASLFAADRLQVNVLSAPIGAASALKACYASSTKAYGALLLATRAAAAVSGVEDALMAEWRRTQPGLAERVDRSAATVNRKAWRFVGEMDDAAAYFASVGIPSGFSEAAARTYERLSALPRDEDQEVNTVMAALAGKPDRADAVDRAAGA